MLFTPDVRSLLTELTRLLDHVVGGVDLSGAFFGDRAHAFGQALRRYPVGMILDDHLAVGALDLGFAGFSRDAERGVGVLELLLLRYALGRGAVSRGPEQRFELDHVVLGEAEPARDANQHLVLGR